MRAAGELYRHAVPANALAKLKEWMETDSPHGRLRAGLVGQLSELTEENGLFDLAQLAIDKSEAQEVRVAAVRGLGAHGSGSLEVSRILLSLLKSPD